MRYRYVVYGNKRYIQYPMRFRIPRDAPRSPNNSSEHKSSVRPEGSRAGYPRIIAKRYCLGSIDLAYKMLGYRWRLRMAKSEGGPLAAKPPKSRLSLNRILLTVISYSWFNDAFWLAWFATTLDRLSFSRGKELIVMKMHQNLYRNIFINAEVKITSHLQSS